MKLLKILLVLSVVSLATCTLAETDSPTSPTQCGQVRGKIIETSKGNCDIYLGIPFAAPPTGHLRFEKPQPGPCWTGALDTTEFGPICVQDGSNGTDPKNESEDCLYLNVFVPRHSDPSIKYPVMVYIHGGGFSQGSAKEYGMEGICENLASRGVIIVTVQYRLFLYGFLSTGKEDALGNLGLWDQIASLQWVKDNIANFGGDPQKITIFGESAGAASVSLLTYTPVAIDLFHQSIAESGYARMVTPVLNDESVASTKKLAEDAKCTDFESKSILECLRRLSTASLQKIYNSHKSPSTFNLTAQWGPRVDGQLFMEADLKELNTGKPAIIGVNSIEFPPMDMLFPHADSIINGTLDNIFNGGDVKSEILKQTARFLYVDSKGDRTNSTFLCEQVSQLITDTMFRAPTAKEAGSKLASGSSTWVYIFDHYSKNVFPPDYKHQKGAPHAHELCFLFLKPLPPGSKEGPFTCPHKYEGDDRIVADHMGQMWTNFAITGNPSPSSLKWPQFQNVTHANAALIRPLVTISGQFYLQASNFWNELVPTILNE